jgi:hypothetical protein
MWLILVSLWKKLNASSFQNKQGTLLHFKETNGIYHFHQKKKLNKQAKKMSWTNNLEIILGTKKIYLPVLNISRHHDFITGGAAKH